MLLQIKEKINVITVSTKEFLPYKIKWRGRVYKITKLGYHHVVKNGNTIHHVFSVATSALAFKINLDTENLSWTLEEVSDGLAD